MTTRSEQSPTPARSSTPERGAQTWRGRLWRYGPLVVWLGVISFASTGALSASNTSRIVRPLLLWLFPGITEGALLEVHFLVRKAAHFTEYAILALLAARAFLSSSRLALSRHWWLASFSLVAVYALLDEYHQSFVASRTASIYDSMIDAAGGACALLLLLLWQAGRNKRSRAERRSRAGG
ncbi:MAG: VanZ family protein [Acidobacteria bacterium]|nr:VanZ family protein [Acidobacteriota bacterium]